MNPCYSGFQVQGTATAPTGMTPSDTQNAAFYSYYIISYNFVKYKWKKVFLKNYFTKCLQASIKCAGRIRERIKA